MSRTASPPKKKRQRFDEGGDPIPPNPWPRSGPLPAPLEQLVGDFRDFLLSFEASDWDGLTHARQRLNGAGVLIAITRNFDPLA